MHPRQYRHKNLRTSKNQNFKKLIRLEKIVDFTWSCIEIFIQIEREILRFVPVRKRFMDFDSIHKQRLRRKLGIPEILSATVGFTSAARSIGSVSSSVLYSVSSFDIDSKNRRRRTEALAPRIASGNRFHIDNRRRFPRRRRRSQKIRQSVVTFESNRGSIPPP